MRLIPTLFAAVLSLGATMAAAQPDPSNWDAVLDEARGQTVYWHAWGGDPRTNDFITWVSSQTEALYGVQIEHVKLSDTAEAVARVVAENAAGRDSGGAVDLIWINGPNFAALKEAGLLFGPFAQELPNARFVDYSAGAAATTDFTVPVEGLESPWRLARFVFIHDANRMQITPATMNTLADWAQENPGRITHPVATNFMGATFLKQALIELTPDPAVLAEPVSDATYDAATAPFWEWYEALRPALWRQGRAFPENEVAQQQLLADGELDLAMSFDPASAANAVTTGRLPDHVRVFVSEAGTIGNISFVAIPFNSSHAAGAMVVADFLLDPTVQARMQNHEVMGALSVLDPTKLEGEGLAAFQALPAAPQLLTLDDLGPTLSEPHPSWMIRLTEDWQQRVTR